MVSESSPTNNLSRKSDFLETEVQRLTSARFTTAKIIQIRLHIIGVS